MPSSTPTPQAPGIVPELLTTKQAAVGTPKAKGWYVTINPVTPALLARA